MSDESNQKYPEKIHKWELIPLRPETFCEFRMFKERGGYRSDDAFARQLIRVYRKWLAFKEKREMKENEK